MKFAGGQRLVADYAKQFGTEVPVWTHMAAQKNRKKVYELDKWIPQSHRWLSMIFLSLFHVLLA